MAAVNRRFPFSPARLRELEVGDFWAVPLEAGGYGCLQVTGLADRGPGSRSVLVAGVVLWIGSRPPMPNDIAACPVVVQGLVGFDVFTEGGAVVLGNVEPFMPRDLDSPFDDELPVGHVSHVWGSRALPKVVADALSRETG